MTFVSHIDVLTVELPFRFSFGHALAERNSSTNVLVRLVSGGLLYFGLYSGYDVAMLHWVGTWVILAFAVLLFALAGPLLVKEKHAPLPDVAVIDVRLRRCSSRSATSDSDGPASVSCRYGLSAGRWPVNRP